MSKFFNNLALGPMSRQDNGVGWECEEFAIDAR